MNNCNRIENECKFTGFKKANYKFNTFWGTEKNFLTVLGEPGKSAGRDGSFELREVAVREGPLYLGPFIPLHICHKSVVSASNYTPRENTVPKKESRQEIEVFRESKGLIRDNER